MLQAPEPARPFIHRPEPIHGGKVDMGINFDGIAIFCTQFLWASPQKNMMTKKIARA